MSPAAITSPHAAVLTYKYVCMHVRVTNFAAQPSISPSPLGMSVVLTANILMVQQILSDPGGGVTALVNIRVWCDFLFNRLIHHGDEPVFVPKGTVTSLPGLAAHVTEFLAATIDSQFNRYTYRLEEAQGLPTDSRYDYTHAETPP
ncbi:hypothetical protein BJX96DRAFT_16893 [Aspergillus floccosus]